MKSPTKGKYVIYSDGSVSVFKRSTVHAHRAKAVGKKPVSAGFYSISPSGKVSISGESGSLGLSPKETDLQKVRERIGYGNKE